MNSSGDTKVKEIVTANPAATRILEGAGIDDCCGGHKSLHDACLHAGVSEEDITERLRQNKSDVRPGDENWIAAPLGDLTRHIRGKHHAYVREAIRRVSPLLANVKTRHENNHPEIAEIEELFLKVARELIMHMQKEEHILFPYIEEVERAANGKATVESPFFQTMRNPIRAMMAEHDAAAALISQIRTASSAYAPPADACVSYQALYRDLQEFEADLHCHVHLENDILFPRAVEMEALVL